MVKIGDKVHFITRKFCKNRVRVNQVGEVIDIIPKNKILDEGLTILYYGKNYPSSVRTKALVDRVVIRYGRKNNHIIIPYKDDEPVRKDVFIEVINEGHKVSMERIVKLYKSRENWQDMFSPVVDEILFLQGFFFGVYIPIIQGMKMAFDKIEDVCESYNMTVGTLDTTIKKNNIKSFEDLLLFLQAQGKTKEEQEIMDLQYYISRLRAGGWSDKNMLKAFKEILEDNKTISEK
jgi:hypothetical protein